MMSHCSCVFTCRISYYNLMFGCTVHIHYNIMNHWISYETRPFRTIPPNSYAYPYLLLSPYPCTNQARTLTWMEHWMDSWIRTACWTRTAAQRASRWVGYWVVWRHWVATMETGRVPDWVGTRDSPTRSIWKVPPKEMPRVERWGDASDRFPWSVPFPCPCCPCCDRSYLPYHPCRPYHPCPCPSDVVRAPK